MLASPGMQLRNVAIIAHVDHGKTTLVDGLLKQSNTFRSNEAAMSQELIMDSNAQERERGITILAKTTAVRWNDLKINIVDTPGHADFGGEVERTLGLADSAILLVDAQEGPMPQTKFVLGKALGLGLRVVVVVNKIDKRDARIPEVLQEVGDLFLDLATTEAQLEYPVLYAIGRESKAWREVPADPTVDADLTSLFEEIEKLPAPTVTDGALQLQVAALDWDSFKGSYAVGRVLRGSVKTGQSVVVASPEGATRSARIEQVFVTEGLKREPVEMAGPGELVSLTGLGDVSISETVCDPSEVAPLPAIAIEPPTVQLAVGPNTSPLAGREGKQVTSRQIEDRLKRELRTNVALRLDIPGDGTFRLSGRGELHLSVLLETMRREGFELQVGKPEVVLREEAGQTLEPEEELTVYVPAEYVSPVTGELGRRKGLLMEQTPRSDGTVSLKFQITTRGALGLRSTLLSLSRGTAVTNSRTTGWVPKQTQLPRLRNGALLASEAGKTAPYGLQGAEERGVLFVGPQVEVYEGMIIGINSRPDDLEVNVCREKKLTNVRASGSDDGIQLTPVSPMSFEEALDFLEDDELLEVTPSNLRLRKRILGKTERDRARKKA